MSLSTNLESVVKPIVLVALVSLCTAGCGTKPSAIDKAGIKALNNQIDRLSNEGKFTEALEKSSVVLMMAEKAFNSDPEFVADARVVHGRLDNVQDYAHICRVTSVRLGVVVAASQYQFPMYLDDYKTVMDAL